MYSYMLWFFSKVAFWGSFIHELKTPKVDVKFFKLPKYYFDNSRATQVVRRRQAFIPVFPDVNALFWRTYSYSPFEGISRNSALDEYI